MDGEPSGEYYDYTVTMKPERPWLLPYHQTLIYRTFNCSRDGEGNMKEVFLNFEESLEVIRRMYHLTRGVPQVVYLTGWQFEGHDSNYPSWAEVYLNPQAAQARMRRPAGPVTRVRVGPGAERHAAC
jgi:hypothetical protein